MASKRSFFIKLAMIAFILVTFVFSIFLFKVFVDPKSTLATASSALKAITAVNEAHRMTTGEYYSSPEELSGEHNQFWHVYWTANSLPEELRQNLAPRHIPFWAPNSYRAVMTVNFHGRTFLIERNSGQEPAVVGEVGKSKD